MPMIWFFIMFLDLIVCKDTTLSVISKENKGKMYIYPYESHKVTSHIKRKMKVLKCRKLFN